jgi:hypothetical protein
VIGAHRAWKIPAPVDLSTPQAGRTRREALNLAGSIGSDITLLALGRIWRRRDHSGNYGR